MAELTKEISVVLQKETDRRERLNSLNERYVRLVQKGIVNKKSYSLPLKDTIGRKCKFNINSRNEF
ncbi:hypothetical protein CMU11_08340 [Elizabethkingia anophelis]|nr:hypothetical protein [Elizabethkingia anophelis]MDV3737115.1 hypothetical protein [Elizabethkingia anophelis]MDV3946398.1 hypothetical protein [Elizabethkingia anophelis]